MRRIALRAPGAQLQGNTACRGQDKNRAKKTYAELECLRNTVAHLEAQVFRQLSSGLHTRLFHHEAKRGLISKERDAQHGECEAEKQQNPLAPNVILSAVPTQLVQSYATFIIEERCRMSEQRC